MMPKDNGCGERPRLLVVANRLPVSAKKTGDNSWSLEMSPGGLVSGLLGVTSQFDTKWIGWPGVDKIFKYFTDRTPRSFFEASEASLVWNYEFADVEFGRAQARDMLHYLWAGPMSNASVDVVRGNHSVEVHDIGETTGTAIGRILGEIVHRESMTTSFDFVFCSGYFLEKDEDIFTFFESEILSSKLSHETRPKSLSCNHSLTKKKKVSLNVLDLGKENYFSAAIGQASTKARYVIHSYQDVVDLLHKLGVADPTTTMTDSFSDLELYQTRNANGNSKHWINSVRRMEQEIGDTGQIYI